MRMSNAEAIMWAVEKDPALRSDFCNLTILDRRPSDTRMRATAAFRNQLLRAWSFPINDPQVVRETARDRADLGLPAAGRLGFCRRY